VVLTIVGIIIRIVLLFLFRPFICLLFVKSVLIETLDCFVVDIDVDVVVVVLIITK